MCSEMSEEFDIVVTSKFKKDLKTYKYKKDILTELEQYVTMIQHHIPLPTKCNDHILTGNYVGKRDCHVRPDDILIYQISGNDLILVRFGSHAKLGLTESVCKLLKLHLKETDS